MEETPNFSLSQPTKGSLDWHVPLNKNYDLIDGKLPIVAKYSNRDNYNPLNNQLLFAHDIGQWLIFNRESDSWKKLNNLGSEGNPVSAETNQTNGVVYARNFEGSGLASKIEEALNWIKYNQDGQGRIRITPKHDGSNWVWDKSLTIDPSEYAGIHIDIDDTVAIEHDTSVPGWTLIINTTSSINAVNNGQAFKMTGGYFNGQGQINSDLDGFCRLQDSTLATIAPSRVERYFSKGTSNKLIKAFEVRNYNSFSEDLIIGPCDIWSSDIAIDFVPSSVSGGEGTDSFDGIEIQSITARLIRNIGIRFRGIVQNSTIHQPTVFLAKDDAIAFYLDAAMGGSSISNPKGEKSTGEEINTVFFRTGEKFGQSPMIINPWSVLDTDYSRFTQDDAIFAMGPGTGSGINSPQLSKSDRFIISDGEHSLLEVKSDSNLGDSSFAVGKNASAKGSFSTSVGWNSTDNSHPGSTVLGRNAKSQGEYGVAIGEQALAKKFGVAIGRGAKVSKDGSGIAIGLNSTSSAHNVIHIGAGGETLTPRIARVAGGTTEFVFPLNRGPTISDDDLNKNEAAFSMDDSGDKMLVRVKTSSGEVKTGSIQFD
ncbi:hypothetical protein [Salinigranum marinum]|uniref:hypothetical protein n=1 Tax=Salinigranum marinum TaxID=1515595 RepID=UPI002989E84D|nr:hypothetical protein [Salinigranum marinum]